MKIILFAIQWLVISFSIYAVEDSKLTLVEPLFKEKYSSNVPVSGRVISGIMTRSNKSNHQFFIDLPALEKDTICFRVQSKDGTYFASNEYKITDKSFAGKISPEYPTQYQDILEGFDASELALLAFVGSCSEKKLNNVLVSSRSSETSSDDVVILVSSGRSDVFLSTLADNGKRKSLKCKRLIKGKRTAYDTECSVKVKDLVLGTNELSIIRRKGGRMLPSVKFNVIVSS